VNTAYMLEVSICWVSCSFTKFPSTNDFLLKITAALIELQVLDGLGLFDDRTFWQ